MKSLTPKQVTKSQVSRLAIVEVIDGVSFKAKARKSIIDTGDGENDIKVTYEVIDEVDGNAPYLQNIGEYLDSVLKPFTQANQDIESIDINGKIMVPGGNYLIPQPALVADSIQITRKDGVNDGGPKSFFVPPSLLSEYSSRLGFITANMFPLPASLAISLIESDTETVRKLRRRINSLPSLWGKHSHKPEYKAILTTYEDEAEASLSWKV